MTRAWSVRTQRFIDILRDTLHFTWLVLCVDFANKVAEWASHVIASKFIISVLLFLEYALVVNESCTFLLRRLRESWGGTKE